MPRSSLWLVFAVALLLACATPATRDGGSTASSDPPSATEAPPAAQAAAAPSQARSSESALPAPSEPAEVAELPAGDGYVIHGNEHGERTAKVPSVEPYEVHVGVPAISPDVIRRVVRTHVDALRACYRLGLDVDPTLVVRIAIDFTIGPEGKVEVAHAHAPESFAFPEIPRCIGDEIQTWSFPAPRGGGTLVVSYPLSFSP